MSTPNTCHIPPVDLSDPFDLVGQRQADFVKRALNAPNHAGIVSYVQSDKLPHLTRDEIRVFLLLYDEIAETGAPPRNIAECLNLPTATLSNCLGTLLREQMVIQVPAMEQDEETGELRQVINWACNHAHEAARGCPLWEFNMVLEKLTE